MDQSGMEIPVTLIIKAPNQKYSDQTISCFLNWTVGKLKTHLSNVYPSKPLTKDQRLVYSGRLLPDHLQLKDILRKQDEYHMVHLVCASRSPPSSPKSSTDRGSHEALASSTSSNSDHSDSTTPSPSQESLSLVTGSSELEEMERLMDDGLEDESGEDAGEDASAAQRPGLMASAWSFITTFFTSLIPEGPPQVAN